MVENSGTVKQVTQVQSQAVSEPEPKPTPLKGKYLGLINPHDNSCAHVLLGNGTVIKDPHDPTLVVVEIDPRAYASNPWWYTGDNAATYDYSGKKYPQQRQRKR